MRVRQYYLRRPSFAISVRYPSISFGTPDEQLRDIRSYLYQLTDTLNACDTSALSVMNEISQAIAADDAVKAGGASSEEALRLQEYSSLRSLIIKTADYAISNSENISLSLSGNYVAVSDFGTYFENTVVTIGADSYGVTQIYQYAAGANDYRVTQENYIKSGLLYYDGGVPVYGVGVGTIYGNVSVYELTTDTNVNHAKTYYTRTGTSPDYTYTPVDEPNQTDLATYYERVMSRSSNQIYSTFTADEIAFWSGSTKLAYMNTGAIYFPNAVITGGSINIGGTALNPAFSVNSSGDLVSTSADISGKVTATSGEIGGFTIGSNTLHAGTSTSTTNFVGLSANTSDTYAIGVGDYRPANAEFSVTRAGALKATSGTIAGWTISGNRLQNSNGSIYLDGNTGYISGATISGGSISGSSISGVTISSGTITGSVFHVDGGLLIYEDSIYRGTIGYTYGTDSEQQRTYGVGVSTSAAVMMCTTGGARMFAVGHGEVYVYPTGATIKCNDSNKIDVTSTGIHMYGTVYSDNTQVHSSDANKKHDINYDVEVYGTLFDGLKPCTFKYNNGTSGRDHFGFAAQDVLDAINAAGLTTKQVAAYCEYTEDDIDTCGLRYGEFVALNTYEIQKLKQRVAALEARIGGQNE